MAGRYSRNKGARGEREVAKLLRSIVPTARRRSSGEESQVDQGRDLDGLPGLCAQVCLSARPPIERKLNEALAAAKQGEKAVAFTRSDRGRWLATMPMSQWLVLWDLFHQTHFEDGKDARTVRLPGGPDPFGEDA